MTEPRDPGDADPAGPSPGREARRGRHWAPDEDGDVAEPKVAAGRSPAAESSRDRSNGRSPAAVSPGRHAAAEDAFDEDAPAPPTQQPAAENATHEDPPPLPLLPTDQPAAENATHEGPPALPTQQPTAEGAPSRAGGEGAPDDASGVDGPVGARSGPRHAAGGRGIRLQPWMLAVGAVVVIGLLGWLALRLTTGTDSAEEPPPTAATTAETTSATPSPVDPASLPQVLCMGQSYAMIDTGQPTEQLLADPTAVEAQYPGSKLSTIPPGCIPSSDARDQVVLALGPFPSIAEACAAGTATGTVFIAYEGSADTGLEPTTCPA